MEIEISIYKIKKNIEKLGELRVPTEDQSWEGTGNEFRKKLGIELGGNQKEFIRNLEEVEKVAWKTMRKILEALKATRNSYDPN